MPEPPTSASSAKLVNRLPIATPFLRLGRGGNCSLGKKNRKGEGTVKEEKRGSYATRDPNSRGRPLSFPGR